MNILTDEQSIGYERTFILESCHFNDQTTYDDYAEAHRLYNLRVDSRTLASAFDKLDKYVLNNIHGHNFLVKVLGIRKLTDKGYVVVWDEELSELVNEWNRTNLSVHPDFKGYRATTEVMAVLLKKKLEKKFGDDIFWTVEVEENRDIRAVAS